MRALAYHPAPRPAAIERRRAVVLFLVLLVAAALLSACGGGDDDLPAVEGPTSPRFEVSATEMAFDPDAVAVAEGDVEVVLHNDGSILHDLRIDGQPFIVEATAGAVATSTVTLEAGSYAFFCSLPGHRDAGMEGVLEVR
ncbi:MAG TPA: plastocyanin/azurin family copper-binding protein [Acidimicrobiales bacterium]